MNLIAIDAGNTRLKWAIYGGDNAADVVARGALATQEAHAAEHLMEEWRAYEISDAIVSNVAGAAIRGAIANALSAPMRNGVAPIFIQSESACCGVRNGYAVPAQLGTDRFAALIAAFHARVALTGGTAKHQLVIMAGTALTIDALTREGEFLGGVIVPGPTLMRQSLNHNTAQLPAQAGQHERFPTSTQNAIATGAIEAAVGAIARMHDHLAHRVNAAVNDIAAIGSGGAIADLAPHLPFAVAINDNLVLDGLVEMWRNANSSSRREAGNLMLAAANPAKRKQ